MASVALCHKHRTLKARARAGSGRRRSRQLSRRERSFLAEELNASQQYIIPFTLPFYSTPHIIIRCLRLDPAAVRI